MGSFLISSAERYAIPKKSGMLVFKTIVAACALREHVCLLCWFIIEWRIKGKPALSHIWLSLAYASPQSITWLILSRALSGVGGGGIVGSVWTITSEIVPVHRRAHWSQALSVKPCLVFQTSAETEPFYIAHLGIVRSRRSPLGWAV